MTPFDLDDSMNEQIYELHIGGRAVRYRLRDPGSARYLGARPVDGGQFDVYLPDGAIEAARERYQTNASDAYLEFELLDAPTAQFLMPDKACVIHGVAIAWRGRAWLFCARSGTGKTTQFRRWLELRPGEIRLVAGDEPVLTLGADGSVLVWASPWLGKERWFDLPGPVPLGGVVFLRQAEENRIERLGPERSARWLMHTFMAWADDEPQIRGLTALADAVISNHPVWLLHNRGDLDSARLTMDTFESEGGLDP